MKSGHNSGNELIQINDIYPYCKLLKFSPEEDYLQYKFILRPPPRNEALILTRELSLREYV